MKIVGSILFLIASIEARRHKKKNYSSTVVTGTPVKVHETYYTPSIQRTVTPTYSVTSAYIPNGTHTSLYNDASKIQ